MAAGFVDAFRMVMGWWSSSGVAAEPENYTVMAAQFYTAGAVQGMIVPNVVTGQEFTAGAIGGDVK